MKNKIKEKVLKEMEIDRSVVYMKPYVSKVIDLTLAKVGKRIITYTNTCLDCKNCGRAWKKLKKEFGIK